MGAKGIISFLIDVIPFVGGLKMCTEAIVKKEMTGEKLTGPARAIHLIIGIGSFGLDAVSGVGGSATRVTAKVLSKGFLRRGAILGAKVAGRGATRTALRGAGKVLTRMEKNYVGRMVVRKAENKIRKKVENSMGRRQNPGYNNRQQILDAQKQKLQEKNNNEKKPEN